LIMLTVCIVGLTHTAECVNRLTGECTVSQLVRRRVINIKYNMLISTSHMQWVQLGDRYCSQLGCWSCYVILTAKNYFIKFYGNF